MIDGAGTEGYAYDTLDRLTSVTRGSDVFSYAYNQADAVTRRTYPGGSFIDYTYDDDSRLASVTSAGVTTDYGYDAANHLISTTLPASNGHTESRGYDRAGRLIEVSNDKGGSMLSKATYTLDPVGNPTTVVTASDTTTYAYDAQDRLTEVCFQSSCPNTTDPYIRYGYDAVGNRVTETRPGGTTTSTYNTADQLTQTSGPLGITGYSYDDNGNQTQAGARSFTYDLANRMSSTTSGAVTTTYVYDGADKRLQASTGSGVSDKVNFLWDPNFGLPQLALERDGAGALLRRYVHGNDLISMTSGGVAYYYHKDGIGSITNVTSASGTPQWSYSYEPFGSSRMTTKINPLAPDNPVRFTGEYLDPTGLYHLRARQFDPSLGRFTATDPLPAGPSDPYVSSYAYVNNRPTLYVDPSGLFCVLGSNPDGSCRGAGVVERGSHIIRAIRNARATGAGAGWANLNGGDCDLREELMVVCNANSYANGSAPALAVGNTVIADSETDVTQTLLQHESVHSDQWARYGLALPGLYFGALATQGACNMFEAEAGYAAGNYEQCLGENRK